MMHIWIVRMAVPHGRVMMPVAVRLSGRIIGAVIMLMMFIVDVMMFMIDRFVHMLMVVAFHHVHIDADTHQQCCSR